MKKTILLTGATGYLGSFLAKALIAQGHKLIILKKKELIIIPNFINYSDGNRI